MNGISTSKSKDAVKESEEDDEQQPLLLHANDESQHETKDDVTTMSLTCFICITLSAFLGDASRGLVVPSIVPFLYMQGANSAFVGYVNGAYSAARLIAAPLFGYWAERRTFRESVVINLAIFIVGNMLYSLAGTPLGSPTMILISRFLVGLGSGTLGLARGYVAMTTSKADRTQWMVYLTAAQFIGYSVTPGLGALLSFADIDIIGEQVEFDGFTGGGYTMVLLGLVNLVMMLYLWIEPAKPRKEQKFDVNSPTPERSHIFKRMLVYFTSWVGVGVLLYALVQFVSRYAVAVYETLSQLIAINNFGWGIFLLGSVSCAFGVVGTIVLFSLKPLSKYISSDENVLFAGLFAIGLGYILFTPWGGVAQSVPLMQAQYCIGSLFIFGIGFPITQALVLSLFSKLLGPIQQSAIMGFMASFGSAARVIGAIAAGWAFQTDQMQLCLVILILVVFLPSGGLWVWHFLYSKRQSHEEIQSGFVELVDVENLKPQQRR